MDEDHIRLECLKLATGRHVQVETDEEIERARKYAAFVIGPKDPPPKRAAKRPRKPLKPKGDTEAELLA